MPSTTLSLVTKTSQLLKRQNWKLVTIESCTGGGVAYALTSLPGSSTWFERGFVTYSNNAKEDMIGVRSQTLLQFGAVSEQTACEMAEGGLRNSEAQISVAITGIAGPDGGSKEKPVGLVWFAVAGIDITTIAYQHIFAGNRQQIREQAIRTALEKVITLLS
ncbi:MAG: CinA family protein [Gammaproteobacteria bacterium]|nr:CinA family protein [Gammaproteobacteria bacterium]